MAMIGTFAMEAIPPGLHIAQGGAFAFAALCCAIVGWPLSRTLSRHLVYWEPCEPRALKQTRMRRLREDDE
jgi:hypothetical protein